MNNMTESVVTIATAIIGVAILAVIVSQRSNTVGVIRAAGNAFSGALGTAVSPVTGSGFGVSMPSAPQFQWGSGF